ncbi:Cysteine-rich secretory protein family protein [Sporomusa ovata DSM 2662]|uniref:Transporter n=1 Tax=Sporomusa ovata TaxID=2378 RepID=A0A0U1L454_9FIRM|nr:CAP domain-containing protein [Sporomusa ovata]EQB25111.1 hypothetical protein SOV_5c02610 [Sporomusa ovata DSM 2662]CQR73664.1 Transporter [Sporomusa ovata]
MKRSIRNALLGLLGTSIGVYMLAMPLSTTAYAYTPYGYHNSGSTKTSSNTQDPVNVVKASSRTLGFNATTDKFTLVSKSATLAVVNVIHNGTSYNVTLSLRRYNGSWFITSVKAIKNSSNSSNTTSSPTTGSNGTGSPTTATGSSSTTSTTSTGTSSGNVITTEQQAVSLLNADRRANGLPDLQVDSRLTTLARNYAQDMLNRNYFSHYSPEGQSPFDRMKQAGITYSAAGENIAINRTVQQAEAAFMNSSGHRANILNSTYTKVGIGIAFDKSGNIYIVQNFIKP